MRKFEGLQSSFGSFKNEKLENVVDIMMILPSLPTSIPNFTYKGQYNIIGRDFYSQQTADCEIHLHVVTQHHGFINLQLLFRQYLIDHPDVMAEYVQLKLDLAASPTALDKHATQMFKNYTNSNLPNRKSTLLATSWHRSKLHNHLSRHKNHRVLSA